MIHNSMPCIINVGFCRQKNVKRRSKNMFAVDLNLLYYNCMHTFYAYSAIGYHHIQFNNIGSMFNGSL